MIVNNCTITEDKDGVLLENNSFRIHLRRLDGAIDSLIVKRIGCEMIADRQLVTAFRICAPVEGYLCNYIESENQKACEMSVDRTTVTVSYRGLRSLMAELDIELTYSITLENENILFRSSLTNHSDCEISEFWFPRIGGITKFDEEENASLAVPGYVSCGHDMNLVRNFPGSKGLGAEAAEYSLSYPEMVMPWWDIYDKASDTGLYLGYHDETMRFSTWHFYLYPDKTGTAGKSMFSKEEACGEPAGLVFSHVRYPFLKNGESYETGEFILRVHEGDWHFGSKYYRSWFMEHFPFDKKDSWLRKKSAWFSSIIYQPEDKMVTDYKGFDSWCKDAEKYGVDCHELLGWDKGGIERDYPEYEPEEKLGGKEGFRELMKSIRDRGSKCLAFANYNIVDSCSNWYKEELYKYIYQDPFGNTPNWMCWGESTLLARKQYAARRCHLTSVIPQMEEILEKYFLEIVRDGASGLQLDKVCIGSFLDFNPLNTDKPDTASCEGLVRSIARMLQKCREINPEFCFASEAGQDRLIPYVDVFYRNVGNYTISPLRYVFPEWTACQHISSPMEFGTVNSAILTGAVIDAEPMCYSQSMDFPIWRKLSEYILEVERIRNELKDIIFLGEYCDTLYGSVEVMEQNQKDNSPGTDNEIRGEVMIPGGMAPQSYGDTSRIKYSVHKHENGNRIAMVVVNTENKPHSYRYRFDQPYKKEALLYKPFCSPQKITEGEILTIDGIGLHILVAES